LPNWRRFNNRRGPSSGPAEKKTWTFEISARATSINLGKQVGGQHSINWHSAYFNVMNEFYKDICEKSNRFLLSKSGSKDFARYIALEGVSLNLIARLQFYRQEGRIYEIRDRCRHTD